MDDRPCPGTGGQGKLVWTAGCVDVGGKHLGQALRNYATQDVANDQASDSSVWFLQSHHSSHPNCFGDGGWESCLG